LNKKEQEKRKEQFLTYKDHRIYCQITGTGPKLLIAFPGYGCTVDFYDPTLPYLFNTFTTWIVDLPLHGQTVWSSPRFTISDFSEIIKLILAESNHTHFSMLGHSFGGRVVLTQIPIFGNQLDRIFLLAPDGIKNLGLMTVHWIPSWFRNITQRWFDDTHRLLPIAEWLHRRGWIAPGAYGFAQFYLKTEHRRRQVKIYWLSLANFQVSLNTVKQTIRQQQIPVSIFVGTRDKVIPIEVGQILKKDLDNHVTIITVEAGHRLEGGAVLRLIDFE